MNFIILILIGRLLSGFNKFLTTSFFKEFGKLSSE